jgi:hypothetical protein
MGLKQLSPHKRKKLLLIRSVDQNREFTSEYESPDSERGTSPAILLGSMGFLAVCIMAILLGLLSILKG